MICMENGKEKTEGDSTSFSSKTTAAKSLPLTHCPEKSFIIEIYVYKSVGIDFLFRKFSGRREKELC